MCTCSSLWSWLLWGVGASGWLAALFIAFVADKEIEDAKTYYFED